MIAGEPVAFNLKDLDLEDRTVLIFYGETEEIMYEALIDHITLKTTIIDEDHD